MRRESGACTDPRRGAARPTSGAFHQGMESGAEGQVQNEAPVSRVSFALDFRHRCRRLRALDRL